METRSHPWQNCALPSRWGCARGLPRPRGAGRFSGRFLLIGDMVVNDVPGGFGQELARVLVSLTAVFVVSVGGLRLLDRIPGLILGTPHGVTRYQSIEQAERALGQNVLVPPYFPDTLRWPPTSVQVATGPSPSVALHFEGRDGRPDRLQICETLGSDAASVRDFLPDVAALETTTVLVEGTRARLRRVLTDDGRLLHELAWHGGQRSFVLRFDGPVDQLLAMAQSLERNHR